MASIKGEEKESKAEGASWACGSLLYCSEGRGETLNLKPLNSKPQNGYRVGFRAKVFELLSFGHRPQVMK